MVITPSEDILISGVGSDFDSQSAQLLSGVALSMRAIKYLWVKGIA